MSHNDRPTPLVWDRPLSEDRIQAFRDEVLRATFNSMSRKVIIFDQLHNPELAPTDREYVKFGVNHILDKIWFVEGQFDGTEWASQGLGFSYGQGIGESEMAHVLQKLEAGANQQNQLNFDEPLSDTILLRGITTLQNAHYSPQVILTSIDDELRMWGYPLMIPSQGSPAIPRHLAGCVQDVPILWSRLVQRGKTYVIDKEAIGHCTVKRGPIVEINEIENEEGRRQVIHAIPQITEDQIREKVQVLVYEVLNFTVQDPQAMIVINSSPNPV